MALKPILRQLPHFLYQVERLAGWLWDKTSGDKLSCWIDWLPAWAYVLRKLAERLYWRRYNENIYGQKMKWR